MRENCRTVKWDSWLLGVLNIVSKSLGKLYPTNLKIIAVVAVIELYRQFMKREHQNMKKNTQQGKQYLIKQVAFTERNCV